MIINNCHISSDLIPLHPYSMTILRLWIEGIIMDLEFTRLFTLPNSRYIDLAFCLIGN